MTAGPAPCDYSLPSAPPQPNALGVTIDGAVVPRSIQQTSGWDYRDSTTIVFFGVYCNQITSRPSTAVASYSCPGP